MDTSGGMIEPDCSAVWELCIMVKVLYSFLLDISVDLTVSISARGGFCTVKACKNLLMLCELPSSSISTPASPRLRT